MILTILSKYIKIYFCHLVARCSWEPVTRLTPSPVHPNHSALVWSLNVTCHQSPFNQLIARVTFICLLNWTHLYNCSIPKLIIDGQLSVVKPTVTRNNSIVLSFLYRNLCVKMPILHRKQYVIATMRPSDWHQLHPYDKWWNI